MSKELSFEKSGGLGKTPWVNAKMSTSTPTVASKMDSTMKAAATVGDRGARQEQLDDVAAAGGHDVVQAHGRDVGAPDAPPLEDGRGVGGPQAFEEGARAHREVEREEQQPKEQRRPVQGCDVREELPGGVEERAEALADRG